MPEANNPKSYDERIAGCPIHKWANIDAYLEEAFVPPHLNKPFHELVLARGEYPKRMSQDDGKTFGKRAVEITETYELLPTEAHALKIIFGQLISQWLSSEAKSN